MVRILQPYTPSTPVDRAMAGAALAPLSNGQKAALCILARAAWDISGSPLPLEEWRREEQQRAVHIRSLRECTNQDYKPLRAHFEDLLGRSDRAFRSAMKAEVEPKSWALHCLYRECSKVKSEMPHSLAYVRGFLLNKRGVTLEEADVKSLWHALFTLRRKVQQERKKAKGGIPAGDAMSQLLSGIAAAKAKHIDQDTTIEQPF